MSQALGVTYDVRSVFWDPYLAKFCNPADHTYWDWMHILVASGGVLQYEVNGFVRAMQATGISLQDLDAFAEIVQWSVCVCVLGVSSRDRRGGAGKQLGRPAGGRPKVWLGFGRVGATDASHCRRA